MRIVTVAGAICVMCVAAFSQNTTATPVVDVNKLTTDCIQKILTNRMTDISRKLQDEIAASVERRLDARLQEKLERMQKRLEERIEKRTMRLEEPDRNR